MNRNLFENSLINLLVIVAWLSEAVLYQFDMRKIAAVVIAFICAVLIHFEKRQGIRFLVVAIVGVIIGLSCFEFFFYATPALLMIAAHREETKNISKEASGRKKERNKETLTGTYLTFAVLLMFVGAIYTVLNFSVNKTDYKNGFVKISAEIIVLFVIVFTLLFSATGNGKKKESTADKGLKSIYILSLIGITETAIIFIIRENYEMLTARFPLSFWLMLVLFMIKNGDANINNLSKRINALFERVK